MCVSDRYLGGGGVAASLGDVTSFPESQPLVAVTAAFVASRKSV